MRDLLLARTCKKASGFQAGSAEREQLRSLEARGFMGSEIIWEEHRFRDDLWLQLQWSESAGPMKSASLDTCQEAQTQRYIHIHICINK